MFLKSIKLKNFKKFKDKEIKFPADLTVIKGPNEQGKSTLVEGLIAGLFYDPTRSLTPQYLRDCQAYHCPTLYQIELNFELEGQDFLLQKDFEKKTILLWNQTSEERETDSAKIKQWLWQKGGYGNPDIFQATACVKQEDLAAIGRQGKALGQVLEDLITSGQNNIRALDILQKINKAYQILTLGLAHVAQKPGPLKVLTDNLSQQDQEIQTAQASLEQKISRQAQHQEIEAKIKAVKLKLKDQETLRLEIERYFEAKKNLEKLKPELDRIVQVLEKLSQIDSQAPKINQLLKAQPKVNEKTLAQFDALEHQRLVYQKELKKAQQIEPQTSETGLMKNLNLLGGFLILLVASILGWLISPWFLIAAGFALLGLSFWLIKKLTWQQLTKQEKQKKTRHLEKQLESLLEKQEKLLDDYQLESRTELVKAVEEIQRLKTKQADLEKHRQHLLDECSFESWQSQKLVLARQIAIEEAKIEKHFQPQPPSSEIFIRLKREIKETQERYSRLEKDLVRLETEINNNPWDQEKINNLAEKLELDQQKLLHLTEKKDALALLTTVLIEARALSLKASLGQIENYTAQYLSLITQTRYSKIKIKEQDLSFSVFSPDKQEFVTAEELSRGTIDQLYLVARLAFLQAISKAARPLVILDDPFVHSDKERAAKICQLLQNLCCDFQMILLTCHDRYDSWGKVVEI